jgi:hypothetical protein
LVLVILRAFEVGDDEAPSWFEHTGDFEETLMLEIIRQVMHHHRIEDNVKRLIGEVQMLDDPNAEIDGQVTPRGFRAGTGDLLVSWVNADDAASGTGTLLNCNRQRSGTAAHIQHGLSWLNAGEVHGSLAKLPQLATQQEGIEEPNLQVVAPAKVEDPPSRLHGHRPA